MASNIRRIRSGKWQIRWTDHLGARRAETHLTERDARLALARRHVEAEELRRQLRHLAPMDRPFGELADAWLKGRAALKRSRKTDESLIRCHLRPHFGELLIRKITAEDVEAFKQSRVDRVSQKTVNLCLTLLCSMFRYGAELGWLAAADLPRIRKYRLRLGAYRWLRTEPEIRRLLAAAREEGANVLALYATAVYTGMRAGELAGLRWGHVDLDRRLITVTSSYDGPTKGGETRHVPILDPLLPILRAWALRSAGELVFAHQNGTMLRRDSRLFQETLKRVLERAQLPRRCIVFHSLRHTFASHWAMRGGDRRRRRPGSRREGAHEPKAA